MIESSNPARRLVWALVREHRRAGGQPITQTMSGRPIEACFVLAVSEEDAVALSGLVDFVPASFRTQHGLRGPLRHERGVIVSAAVSIVVPPDFQGLPRFIEEIELE